MRGITFTTGSRGRHQQAMITWARRRLADRSGGTIAGEEPGHRWDQAGALIADGVGMGKTWEALGAAAVILATQARWLSDGRRRETLKHELGRVLVITPPNLVDKWSDEINRRGRDRFHHHLMAWTRSRPKKRKFILETLSSADYSRFRRDLPSRADIDSGGIFIVNQLLIDSPWSYAAIDRIRQEPWDLVIIDEAHHTSPRRILCNGLLVKHPTDRTPLILLSATPFELNLKELGSLMDHLGLGAGGRLIRTQAVLDYVAALQSSTDRTTSALSRSVSTLFRQFMARNRSDSRSGTSRRYHFLSADGVPTPCLLTANPIELGQQVAKGCIAPNTAFQSWYLAERLRLKGTTAASDPTCIANNLRQLLSTPGQAKGIARSGPPPSSPRLDALVAWYRTAAIAALTAALRDGNPRKTLIFTSYVRSAAEDLQVALSKAFAFAVSQVAKQHSAWQPAAMKAIDRLQTWCERHISSSSHHQCAIQALMKLRLRARRGRPTATLLQLAQPRFVRILKKELEMAVSAAQRTPEEIRDEWGKPDSPEAEANLLFHAKRVLTTQRRDLKWLLEWLGDSSSVMRFDGETSGRNRFAFGFQARVGPWAMVASRVGSEGIDLHTWARHLVHFDLEWNPAVMEQREGRCDRIGRKLREDLDILFLIVRDTYDERMLHQVAVRQELHRLILGIDRNDVQKSGDLPRTLIANLERLKEMELDLRPRKR
jgi:superfamily II DNA or RNA helicase